VKISDAVKCINELSAKGNTACKAGYGTTFCRQVSTEIVDYRRLNPGNNGGITQSSW